ncbi:hypothetical protein LSAT2_001395 [Lamellibrachia satsuma]|nr:hypothetical protein LSAT2_001395 [Lamellibrachia satsuma]
MSPCGAPGDSMTAKECDFWEERCPWLLEVVNKALDLTGGKDMKLVGVTTDGESANTGKQDYCVFPNSSVCIPLIVFNSTPHLQEMMQFTSARLPQSLHHGRLVPTLKRTRSMPSLWQTSATSSTSSACGNPFCPVCNNSMDYSHIDIAGPELASWKTRANVYEISKIKEDAFFVVDLNDIVNKFRVWKRLLPRVQPFYGVEARHLGGDINNDIMDHSVGSIDNEADEAVAAAVEKVLSATMGAKRTINQSQSTKSRRKQKPSETDTTTIEAAAIGDIVSQVVAVIQPIIIKSVTAVVTSALSTSTKLIVDKIKEELQTCLQTVKEDALEQYSLRDNIKIIGFPETAQGRTEDTSRMVIDMCEKIGVDVACNDISTSHRIPGRAKAIVCKFV